MPIIRPRRQSDPETSDTRRLTRATSLLDFVRRETDSSGYYGLFFIGSVSGISSAALLAIINIGAETANQGYVNLHVFLMFLVGMALFIYCKRFVMDRCSAIFGQATNRIKLRLVDKLRHGDYQSVETMGEGVIYNRLTKEVEDITFFSPLVADAAQGAVMVLFSLVYLYTLSKLALVLIIGTTIFAAFFFVNKQREITGYVTQSTQKSVELFDSLTHLLHGFREIKLNGAKNQSLMGSIRSLSLEANELFMRTSLAGNFSFIFSQICFYTILGAIVFVLPHFVLTYPDVAIKTTVTILFMQGALEQMVGVLPHYSKIKVAISNLYALEDELDEIDERSRGIDLVSSADLSDFRQIQFDGVHFHYRDETGQSTFTIGPLNFSLNANEIVFVVGGNGSGKSTMIKVLTGLYYAESGSILTDGVQVTAARHAGYRNLFGGVLSDFHLFDRIYGVENIDAERVDEWLRIMQLEQKTTYVDGRFTNLDLSSGQRARLALIIALMEDKPVYILDEWAAPQDPEFREYFYETILADLKRDGKTVIVVSHDDRYFHVADRLLRIEYGQILEGDGTT